MALSTSTKDFYAARIADSREADRVKLVSAIRASGGNVAAAARALGLEENTIWKRCKVTGVDVAAIRAEFSAAS